jgi:hypothetical protein
VNCAHDDEPRPSIEMQDCLVIETTGELVVRMMIYV